MHLTMNSRPEKWTSDEERIRRNEMKEKNEEWFPPATQEGEEGNQQVAKEGWKQQACQLRGKF